MKEELMLVAQIVEAVEVGVLNGVRPNGYR